MRKIITILTIITLILGLYIANMIRRVGGSMQQEYGYILVRDARGHILTSKGLPGGYMKPYSGSLDARVFEVLVSIEDRRFYEHSGIDYRAKISSIQSNIMAGKIVRGGSTITEQYIKNRYFRDKKRTIKQKIDEAIVALWVELTHSKEEIFRGYLDNIYFGNHTYGIQAAIELYFPGKNPETLKKDDILDIITRIHSPNIGGSYEGTSGMYRANIAERLGWSEGSGGLNTKYVKPSIELYPMITQRLLTARHIYCKGDDSIIKKWVYTIPESLCESSSMEVDISISLELQQYAHEILQKNISRIEKENVTSGALYIYNPTDKKILAYIGNRGTSSLDGKIDMITRRRSVGSILKPFIYLMALREGAELDSYVLDDARTYPTGVDGKVFLPQNYNPKIYGPIRLKEALGNSLNSSTVRLSEALGIGKIYNSFIDSGLSLEHDAGYYGYGISLGTVELSLENIVESYASLVNSHDTNIFLIKKALSESKNRSRTFGVSSILGSSIDLPVKTGTSTDFRDNWIVSYHEDAIIGIWVGNADGSPMQDVSGVSGAGPIWHMIAEYMIATGLIRPRVDDIPPGVTETMICLDIRCLQKEQTYMKNPGTIKSRPLDKVYYEEDFVGVITEEEKVRWNIE